MLTNDQGRLCNTYRQYISTFRLNKRGLILTEVLDDMRERFRDCEMYFADTLESMEDYLPENVLGVPTEREESVLVQNLPVYRCLFRRNKQPHQLQQQTGDNAENRNSEPQSS